MALGVVTRGRVASEAVGKSVEVLARAEFDQSGGFVVEVLAGDQMVHLHV